MATRALTRPAAAGPLPVVAAAPLAVAATTYAVVAAEADVALEIAANVMDSGVTRFDLDRLRLPSGGLLAWQVPSLEGKPKIMEEITGVILGRCPKRAYWSSRFGEGDIGPPQCSSEDAKRGVGEPGGDCLICPLAQFGSGTDSSGRANNSQACKSVIHMLFLFPEEFVPLLLQVPPTSLKKLRTFAMNCARRGYSSDQVEVRLGLEQMKSGGGITYSVIAPTISRVLTGEERARMSELKSAYAPILLKATVESARPRFPGQPGDEDAGAGWGDTEEDDQPDIWGSNPANAAGSGPSAGATAPATADLFFAE